MEDLQGSEESAFVLEDVTALIKEVRAATKRGSAGRTGYWRGSSGVCGTGKSCKTDGRKCFLVRIGGRQARSPGEKFWR